MSAPPIPCVWAQGVFTPLPRFQNVVAAHYGEGEVVNLVRHEERSANSHAHMFAWLHDAWLSLPEALKDEYPTERHLRQWALIKAGFYHETRIDVGTRAGAVRVAHEIRALLPPEDFCAVVARGPLIVVRRAKSQSRSAMDREAFKASKDGVLNEIAGLLGVEPDQLQQARAA